MSSAARVKNPALEVTLAGVPSPVRYANGGPVPPKGTISALFFKAVEQYDRPKALLVKQGGTWTPIAHRTILERVRRVALGLKAMGVAPGDRVAILSENRPEWLIADYACVLSGVTNVPIYPTLPPEQIPYILNDSGAKAIFVSTREQAAKIASVRDRIPTLTHVIGFDATTGDGADVTLADVEASGAANDSDAAATDFRATALAIEPDALLTLIYTSGTTGNPKGVMLSHDNVHSNVVASSEMLPVGQEDIALSHLPLSHIFERMGAYLMFANGVTIAYAESIDTVAANMMETRPTMLLSVPRLYEKIHARVLENATAAGGLKKRIFLWAQRVGERWTDAATQNRAPSALLAWQYGLATKLVFSKLKERTGGRMHVLVSGGAPLPIEIARFFYAAGLRIREGYGLTETSPVIAVNSFDQYRIGTVGRPIKGVEVMIANDGEILTRGPHVMQGYFNNPDATADAIDEGKWFHTGDIGELVDGFLRITDRKKDLIVTAGGKNIAPQPIENRIRMNKFVAQAVMIGDKRKFPSVLVVPEWEQVEKWAKAEGVPFASRAELAQNAAVCDKLTSEVMSQLTGLAHFETPKKVAVLEHDFTIERGELTPKMSVKRRAIDQMYKGVIDRLYADAGG